MNKIADQDRFLELIEQSKRLIYKVCFTYGRSEAVRQDLFQEIVLQVWRAFDKYDSKRKFSTWLYRIAINTAISFVRKETRKQIHERSTDTQFANLSVSQPAKINDPKAELLNQAIVTLSEINKAILLLHFEGNDHAEIGQILGMTATNVGTRMGRIKQQLKQEITRLQD